MQKIQFLGFIIILLLFTTCDRNDELKNDTNDSGHPRLLLLEGEEQEIQNLINSNETWEKMHSAILGKCDQIMNEPPVERELTGRRLLGISRECLRRVFYLSYAYRMTDAQRFLNRAKEEMLAVSGFSDWNPSHFLDVAEMTMAVAIGYDWLYEELSESTRKTLREAIVNKGIDPSYNDSHNWFLDASHNWNQVCNAGMVYGALAVQEDYPELAEKTIDRAYESINRPMEEYEPDGAYPEGYSYWGYGTSFNVMFLSAVEKTLETDKDLLTENKGFLETGEFLLHMLAPSGKSFNWSDCSTSSNLSPAMFWFAERNNNPSLLWSENIFLQTDDYSQFTWIRFLPAIMIWGKDISPDQVEPPSSKFWVGQGDNPVAMMRTSWTDPQAIYVGFKAGSPSVNHGHMDIGSFVLEADGLRWASDLGMQDYESLESKGIDIWNSAQDGERWNVFRMNNYSHNVLIVDDELQQVDGFAEIDRYSDAKEFSFAISEITSVYKGQLKNAKRGIGIKEEQFVVIRDELETLDKTTKVRWNMLTHASVETGNKEATLTLDGKKMSLKVKGPDNVVMRTWSTEPPNDYDAENPGTVMVGFECELPANTKENFEVIIVPEDADASAEFINKRLEDW